MPESRKDRKSPSGKGQSPRRTKRRPRARGWPEWAHEFLEKLEDQGGVVQDAARLTGVSGRAVYDLRYDEESFEVAMDKARKRGKLSLVDELEESALARAARGHLEPIYYQGERVGAKRVYSAEREKFFLRALRPDIYNVPTQVQADVNSNVTHGVLLSPNGVSPDDWVRLTVERTGHAPAPDGYNDSEEYDEDEE